MAPKRIAERSNMIELTKMNNEKFFISPHLVEIAESTPDTMITTISGKKYYVLETVQEVVEKITNYYKDINSGKQKKSKT